MSLGERISEARRRAGLTQAGIAKRFGISAQAVSQWEAGRAKPDVERLEELARILDVDFLWLCFGEEASPAREGAAGTSPGASDWAPRASLTGLPPGPPPGPPSGPPSGPPPGFSGPARPPAAGARPRQSPQPPAGPASAPVPGLRDLPVLGIAVGGADAGFEFNGETVDHVARPPALAGASQPFALYVTNDSMAPRFEPGDLVIVHPSRPPQPGCDVVIEMAGEPGTAGRCHIKRLRRRTAEAIIAEQFNPPRSDLRYPVAQVRRVMRILTLAELLGG